MPPSSSTSSSSRGHRGALVIAGFAVAFAAALAASAWRLAVHGMSRDRSDRVVHEVTRMHGTRLSAIVLSDSVTAALLFPSKPAPGVLPMATNGYMRLAGQYLLFRRFIEDNDTKRMYLFAHPSLFALDLSDDEGNGLPRYTYVDSVFTRADEVQILKEAHGTPRRSIEPRFERLLKSWYPNFEPRPFSLEMWHVVASDLPAQRDAGPRPPPPLTFQIRYVLGRFEADCRARGIECTIIEEPSRPGEPHYDVGPLRVLFPGLRFVDSHDFVSFPTSSFPDGMHLDYRGLRHYASAIQAHVAKILDDRVPPWDGTRIDFSRTDSVPLFSEDLHGSEPWGAWAGSARVRLRFTAASELSGGEFRVALRVPPQPAGTTGVPVSLWLDGEKRAEKVFPPDINLREVTFKTGATVITPGSTHVLEVRIPRTVNLRAMGISSDPRDLGPGLAYAGYCGPGRCGEP
jgi:hypothetical protein